MDYMEIEDQGESIGVYGNNNRSSRIICIYNGKSYAKGVYDESQFGAQERYADSGPDFVLYCWPTPSSDTCACVASFTPSYTISCQDFKCRRYK